MKTEECSGVYGIYVDGELVYIGKTSRSFKERFIEHKRLLEFPDDSQTQYDMYYELAQLKEAGHFLQLRPIIIAEKAPYDSLYPLTNRDLESMEFALILIHQPRYNIRGRIKPYKYTH